MSTQEEREAEVAALIERAKDPNDSYDGHHGNDRSEESLAYAAERNTALAEHIMENIVNGEVE